MLQSWPRGNVKPSTTTGIKRGFKPLPFSCYPFLLQLSSLVVSNHFSQHYRILACDSSLWRLRSFSFSNSGALTSLHILPSLSNCIELLLTLLILLDIASLHILLSRTSEHRLLHPAAMSSLSILDSQMSHLSMSDDDMDDCSS